MLHAGVQANEHKSTKNASTQCNSLKGSQCTQDAGVQCELVPTPATSTPLHTPLNSSESEISETDTDSDQCYNLSRDNNPS